MTGLESQSVKLACRTPNGIRTRAATLKGWCPRPLDDGGLCVTAIHFDRAVGLPGFEPGASSSRTKRATKLRYSPWLVNPTTLAFSGQID